MESYKVIRLNEISDLDLSLRDWRAKDILKTKLQSTQLLNMSLATG